MRALVLAACLCIATCDVSVAAGFPTRADVLHAIEGVSKLSPEHRRKKLFALARSLLHPRTQADEDLLVEAAWKLARLYQRLDDDVVLDAILAAGFDTGPATTVFAAFTYFVQSNPAFLRRHHKAERLVEAEQRTIRSLADLQRECIASQQHFEHRRATAERHGHRPPKTGFLIAGTDPSARVAVDGKDTGLTTPVQTMDGVVIGTGKHRVSFTAGGRTTDVDIDLPPNQNACVFQALSGQELGTHPVFEGETR